MGKRKTDQNFQLSFFVLTLHESEVNIPKSYFGNMISSFSWKEAFVINLRYDMN